MGFFKDFKEELSQAVNDLTPETDKKKNEVETEDDVSLDVLDELDDLSVDNLDSLFEDEDDEAEQVQPVVSEVKEDIPQTEQQTEAALDAMVESEADEPEMAMEQAAVAEEPVMPVMEESDIDTLNSVLEEDVPDVEEDGALDEVTVITKGAAMEGNMNSQGSIEVLGSIRGNVSCKGKLTVVGRVDGDSQAEEVFLNGATVKGDIKASGSVKIGSGTVIIGNLTATSAVIAGAIRGNLDVEGPVIIDSTAVIYGDIKSRSVQINNGAVIEGHCSQCYSDVDVDAFFEI